MDPFEKPIHTSHTSRLPAGVLQRTEQRLKLQTLLPCQRQRPGSESRLLKRRNPFFWTAIWGTFLKGSHLGIHNLQHLQLIVTCVWIIWDIQNSTIYYSIDSYVFECPAHQQISQHDILAPETAPCGAFLGWAPVLPLARQHSKLAPQPVTNENGWKWWALPEYKLMKTWS